MARKVRQSRMRVALPIALATFTLASSALANDVPKYADIPVGRLTTVPAGKTPAVIAARERVPGFFVAAPKFEPSIPVRARHISIVGAQEQADAIRRGEGTGADDREIGVCFSESRAASRGLDEEDPEAHEWSSGQNREVNLWPKSKDNEEAGVSAVHSERLVEENGKMRFESVDAWVDPATQGARLITRSTLPLVVVGTAIGGVKIYAGRDERDAAGPRFVQFIIVRPGTAATARAGTLMAMRQDGNASHGNGCGHLRIPLIVDAKAGDSAIVQVSVELPSHEDPDAAKARAEAAARVTAEAKVDPAKADDAPGGPNTANPLKAKRRFKGKRTPPPPMPPPRTASLVEREVRTRDVEVHLSVSQTTRDKDPLVAVSFGWSSREAVQRVMDEGSPPPGATPIE